MKNCDRMFLTDRIISRKLVILSDFLIVNSSNKEEYRKLFEDELQGICTEELANNRADFLTQKLIEQYI